MKMSHKALIFKYLTQLVCCLLVVGCSGLENHGVDLRSSQSMEWKVFRGAWFQITYPGDFKPIPSLQSSSSEGFDSAKFISPDGRTSFYVYAPQWGGEPVDIALDPQSEFIVEETSEEQDGQIISRLIICGNDRSYCRTIDDTIDQQGTVRITFEFKYSSDEVWQEYSPLYLAFQNSLQHYTD